MKKMPISILCGIIAVLVTIILYFTILGNIFLELICFVTLLGVILAEVFATFLAYRSAGNPGKVASAVLATFMIPISIILSSVYIVNFPYSYGAYLGYYFSIFAILMLIIAIIWRFSDGIQEKNKDFQNAKESILNLRKVVKVVMTEPGAAKYIKELNDIEEKLHFSNSSVITSADSELFSLVNELRTNINNEGYDIPAQLELISKKIEIRNIFADKTIK